MYTNDYFDTMNIRILNLDCGFLFLKSGIGVGCSSTNKSYLVSK